MRMDLAFGKTGLTVTLPEGYRYRVLEARSAQPLPDPLAAIESALDSPVATPPLADLARGKSSAAISVCDITRPAPNPHFLPPLLAPLAPARNSAPTPSGWRAPLRTTRGAGHCARPPACPARIYWWMWRPPAIGGLPVFFPAGASRRIAAVWNPPRAPC